MDGPGEEEEARALAEKKRREYIEWASWALNPTRMSFIEWEIELDEEDQRG